MTVKIQRKAHNVIVLISVVMMMCGVVDVNLAEDVVAQALVEQGDVSRLQHVLAKARRGEAVTVGVIGGSITQGARASAPDKCWGALTAAWWQQTFPDSAVTFVNAGIGATGSDLAVHRAKQHLLNKSPDVVIVEFAVNDSINPIEMETLEGLVRQLLNAPQQPAVLLFFTMNKDGNSKQQEHERVGRHYALPMVSLRNALWPRMQAGEIAWTDFEADEVHPNDLGHGYCSQMLTGFMGKILATLPKDDALPDIPSVPQPFISDVFEHTVLYNADTLQPVKSEGWEAGPKDAFFGTGWKTETPGSLLEFEVEGKAVSVLFWKIKGPMGRAEAWVDDGKPVELEAWFNADWGGYTSFQLVDRDLSPGKHTLHIRTLEEANPNSTGHEFQLRAVMTAGKDK